MMRTKLLTALAVAGTLALAACSSNGNSGSPTPATTPSTSAAATTSGAAGGSSETGAGQSQTSQGAPSSSEEGSSATDSTVTINGSGLDGQTAVWFSAFCTGLGPALTSMEDSGAALATATGADLQKAAVSTYGTLGEAFSKTADSLKALPAPGFDQGDKFASEVVAALSSTGSNLKDAAGKVQADDPTDQAALQKAIEDAEEGMSSSMDSLNKYEMSDDMQKALDALPACKVFTGDDSESSTTG